MAPQRSLSSSLGESMRSFSMRSLSARWRATSQHENDAGQQPPDTIGRAGSLLRDLEPAPATDTEAQADEPAEYLLCGPEAMPQMQQRTMSADDGVAPVVVDVARFRTAPARRGGSGGAGSLEAQLHGSNGGYRAPPPAASTGKAPLTATAAVSPKNCCAPAQCSIMLQVVRCSAVFVFSACACTHDLQPALCCYCCCCCAHAGMGAVGLTEAGVTAAAAAAAHRGHSHLNGTQAPSSSVPRPIGTPAVPVAASSIKQRGMAPKRGSLATFKHIFAKSRIREFQEVAGLRPVLDDDGYQSEDDENGSNGRLRKTEKVNPQAMITLTSCYIIRLTVIANMAASVAYMYWRFTETITNNEDDFLQIKGFPVVWWAWTFFATEICLIIALWIGHTQRIFAVQRVVVSMDDLAASDSTVGYNARVCLLIPTAGERLDILLKALLGAVSQKMWHTRVPKANGYRIVVLDEKRRKSVLNVTAALYAVATLVRHKNVITILQAEGLEVLTASTFYFWWKDKGGHARKHLYNNPTLNQ
eukprot:15965-Heterococcus_DN1.PRE.5